jgi:hypothetical protein
LTVAFTPGPFDRQFAPVIAKRCVVKSTNRVFCIAFIFKVNKGISCKYAGELKKECREKADDDDDEDCKRKVSLLSISSSNNGWHGMKDLIVP